MLEKHYADLAGRPFFPGLVSYMQLGPVVPMVRFCNVISIFLTFESFIQAEITQQELDFKIWLNFYIIFNVSNWLLRFCA